MTTQKIRDAQAGIEIAERRLCKAVNEAYPAGSEVGWQRGRRRTVQYGVVLYTSDHGCGDRLRVRNLATSKSYWITLYDIECAHRILHQEHGK